MDGGKGAASPEPQKPKEKRDRTTKGKDEAEVGNDRPTRHGRERDRDRRQDKDRHRRDRKRKDSLELDDDHYRRDRERDRDRDRRPRRRDERDRAGRDHRGKRPADEYRSPRAHRDRDSKSRYGRRRHRPRAPFSEYDPSSRSASPPHQHHYRHRRYAPVYQQAPPPQQPSVSIMPMPMPMPYPMMYGGMGMGMGMPPPALPAPGRGRGRGRGKRTRGGYAPRPQPYGFPGFGLGYAPFGSPYGYGYGYGYNTIPEEEAEDASKDKEKDKEKDSKTAVAMRHGSSFLLAAAGGRIPAKLRPLRKRLFKEVFRDVLVETLSVSFEQILCERTAREEKGRFCTMALQYVLLNDVLPECVVMPAVREFVQERIRDSLGNERRLFLDVEKVDVVRLSIARGLWETVVVPDLLHQVVVETLKETVAASLYYRKVSRIGFGESMEETILPSHPDALEVVRGVIQDERPVCDDEDNCDLASIALEMIEEVEAAPEQEGESVPVSVRVSEVAKALLLGQRQRQRDDDVGGKLDHDDDESTEGKFFRFVLWKGLGEDGFGFA